MGKNMSDINPMSLIVYGCYQAGLVSTDIENRQIADFISTRKGLPKFVKRIEISAFNNPVPGFKCSGTIRMFCSKFEQALSSDDVHVE